MPDAVQAVDAYIAAWNASDRAAREAILQEIWAEDAQYADPNADVRGRQALVALIEARRAARPGAAIERISAVDSHHAVARFGWRLVAADGTPQPDSIDFVTFDETGRFTSVIGFFGPLAASPGPA